MGVEFQKTTFQKKPRKTGNFQIIASAVYFNAFQGNLILAHLLNGAFVLPAVNLQGVRSKFLGERGGG